MLIRMTRGILNLDQTMALIVSDGEIQAYPNSDGKYYISVHIYGTKAEAQAEVDRIMNAYINGADAYDLR